MHAPSLTSDLPQPPNRNVSSWRDLQSTTRCREGLPSWQRFQTCSTPHLPPVCRALAVFPAAMVVSIEEDLVSKLRCARPGEVRARIKTHRKVRIYPAQAFFAAVLQKQKTTATKTTNTLADPAPFSFDSMLGKCHLRHSDQLR